jgi:hypothetical protein
MHCPVMDVLLLDICCCYMCSPVCYLAKFWVILFQYNHHTFRVLFPLSVAALITAQICVEIMLEARDWETEFDSQRSRDFSLVHTGSGVHANSYPMHTGSTFSGSKLTNVWKWQLIPINKVVQRMRMIGTLYSHSLQHHHGVVSNHRKNSVYFPVPQCSNQL